MTQLAAMGGAATKAKLAGQGFNADELADLNTVEDAKRALDEIRKAALSRRITHAEANAASKAVSEWVKAEGAAQTARLISELQRELDARTAEIADLRKQLANPRLRVAR